MTMMMIYLPGTPIPGNTLSPQTSNPSMGVPGNGKDASPARIAGP